MIFQIISKFPLENISLLEKFSEKEYKKRNERRIKILLIEYFASSSQNFSKAWEMMKNYQKFKFAFLYKIYGWINILIVKY